MTAQEKNLPIHKIIIIIIIIIIIRIIRIIRIRIKVYYFYVPHLSNNH